MAQDISEGMLIGMIERLIGSAIESLRADVRAMIEDEMPDVNPLLNESPYNGPFRAYRGSDGTKVYVTQGYVYAGFRAEWDFPSASSPAQNNYLSVAGLADGNHLLYMSISVDSGWGYFTAVDYPFLASTAIANFAQLQAETRCEPIIAVVSVKDGLVTGIKQHQYGNIYCPTFYIYDTSDENSWYCKWSHGNLHLGGDQFVYDVDFETETALSKTALVYGDVPAPSAVDEENGGAA